MRRDAHFSKALTILAVLFLSASQEARAQSEDAPKVEVGVHFSSLSLTPPEDFLGTENNHLILAASSTLQGVVNGGAGTDLLEVETGGADRRTVVTAQIRNFEDLVANGSGTLVLLGGNYGFNSVTGEWIIEGYGVDPDIEVDQDPIAVLSGRDPQLERAVQEVLRIMREKPMVLPTRPAPPVRIKK